MSTTSSAIKTALFTLFVPLVVAGYVPQQMVDGSPARLLLWEVIGGLLVILGAIGYFWCAALFVKAQGTPAPIFPTKRAVVTGLYRINRNPMYTLVLAVVFGQGVFYQSGRLAWYGVFLFVCMHLLVGLLRGARSKSTVQRRIRRILPAGTKMVATIQELSFTPHTSYEVGAPSFPVYCLLLVLIRVNPWSLSHVSRLETGLRIVAA